MKVVILAGGFGTRISEESRLKPKPMVEIGGHPILWHIMKIYSHYGFNEFIICAGYKQQIVKEWFANYYLHCSDVTFDFTKKHSFEAHRNTSEPWKVTIVDTGYKTMTGGRLKRIKEYLNDSTFMLTYGDGVADIDIDALIKHHKSQEKIATITAVQPEGRFGGLSIESGGQISSFAEKKKGDGGWINGGFMVLEPSIIDLIEDDSTVFEKGPLEHVANSGELSAYKHEGFWRCMDTLRDRQVLEELYASGNAPWEIWNA